MTQTHNKQDKLKMKFLNKIWNWIKNNAVAIAIGGLVLSWILANNAVIQSKTQSEKEVLACKTLCFPQQSEYITHIDTAACWCYVDQTSMRKAE